MAESHKACDGPLDFRSGPTPFLYGVLRNVFRQQPRQAFESRPSVDLVVPVPVLVDAHLAGSLALPQRSCPARLAERTLEYFTEEYTERVIATHIVNHYAGVDYRKPARNRNRKPGAVVEDRAGTLRGNPAPGRDWILAHLGRLPASVRRILRHCPRRLHPERSTIQCSCVVLVVRTELHCFS